MLDKVLSLVAPHECVGCGVEPSLLCSDCSKGLSVAAPRCYRCHRASEDWRTCPSCRRKSKLFCLRARSRYLGDGEELVRKLKYSQAVSAAKVIAAELAPLLPNTPSLLVTYLPTASSRVRGRGFDQARLIARELAKNTGLSYAPLLARIGQDRQVGASRAARYQNANKMFRVCNQSLIANSKIVVIDDVVTTGASLEAAAAVLRAKNAKRIYGLVFCQA